MKAFICNISVYIRTYVYVLHVLLMPSLFFSFWLVFRNENMLSFLRQSMEMVSGLCDALGGVPAHNRPSVRRQLKRTRSDTADMKMKATMRYVRTVRKVLTCLQ